MRRGSLASLACLVLTVSLVLGILIPVRSTGGPSGPLPAHVSTALGANGLARFLTYPVPAELREGTGLAPGTQPVEAVYESSGAEPSIGFNPRSGAVLYQDGSLTYRVRFSQGDEAAAAWDDRTSPFAEYNRDPILFTDATGRTFAGGLIAAGGFTNTKVVRASVPFAGTPCSNIQYTDDDGATWLRSINPCSLTTDHETIGGGPSSSSMVDALHKPVIYYCAQQLPTAVLGQRQFEGAPSPSQSSDSCSASLDGGVTFGPPALLPACGGLHGHIKVAQDGTAYLPNRHCAGRVGAATTSDDGRTWQGHGIPGSEGATGFDPSIGITPDGTAYEAWSGRDAHPLVARTRDHGASWSPITDLASSVDPPLTASTLHAVVAGDDDRVAVAFLGSTTQDEGDPFSCEYEGTWGLYIAMTYDGGAHWATSKATTDPVQRGGVWPNGGTAVCRNLLDFMDATKDAQGRVLVAFTDGCVDACALAGGTKGDSTGHWATIARQATGCSLLKASDLPGTDCTADPNEIPLLAIPGGPVQTVAEGDTLAFTVAASDPDGDPVTLSAHGLPPGAGFDPMTGAFAWTPDPDGAAGSPYNVTFVAGDGRGAAQVVVGILVMDVDRPPALEALADRTVEEGDPVRIEVRATDPGGDALVLDMHGLPAGATFTDRHDGTGWFSWVPGKKTEGTHALTATATDGAGLQAATSMTLRVQKHLQAATLLSS